MRGIGLRQARESSGHARDERDLALVIEVSGRQPLASPPPPLLRSFSTLSIPPPSRTNTRHRYVAAHNPPIIILGVMKGTSVGERYLASHPDNYNSHLLLGGTTSMWGYLTRHPQVKAAAIGPREPSYFSKGVYR